MRKESANAEAKDARVTYYFTILFMAIGTMLVFYVLYQNTERLTLFMILLAICGGGLPIGVVGAFIDYRRSEFKVKNLKKATPTKL